MLKTIGTITTLALVLICASLPAQAQTGEKVLETLTDFLRGGQQLQGYVVVIHDADVVVQGRDGRLYTISTAEMDRSQLARLHPGKQVRVSLRRDAARGMIAAAVEPMSGDQRSYRTLTGVVQSVSGDQVRVRTNEAAVLQLDLGQIVGDRPMPRPGDQVAVTYEPNRGGMITAVWIESHPSFGAASPRTTEKD